MTDWDDRRYREYWAYFRHIESLRLLIGTVLTVVGGAAIGLIGSDLGQGLGKLRVPVLIGLGLLVRTAQMFLVTHKLSYDYFDALEDLEAR